MRATSCSSMRRAPGSAASPARTGKRRSTAWMPTATLSRLHRSSSPNTAAGTRPNICSAKATARRDPPSSSTTWKPARHRFQRRDPAVADFEFRSFVDRPENNPGVDLPYQLALPTYAATAWYHHKIPGTRPKDLPAFVKAVEEFAMGDYASALRLARSAGTTPCRDRQQAARHHRPARRVHPQGRSAHRRRRIRKDPSGRRRADHRPSRHAFLGHDSTR